VRREGVSRATLDYPTASLIFVVGTERYFQPADSCLTTLNPALAPGQNYESGGQEFESLRARHSILDQSPNAEVIRVVGDREVGRHVLLRAIGSKAALNQPGHASISCGNLPQSKSRTQSAQSARTPTDVSPYSWLGLRGFLGFLLGHGEKNCANISVSQHLIREATTAIRVPGSIPENRQAVVAR
jgi:hypothetical protein